MARYYNYSARRKRRHTATEKFAYNLARVQVGLDNPESRISKSYERGARSTEHKRRTLF